VALAVAAGAALVGPPGGERSAGAGVHPLALAGATAALALLGRLDLAHLAYDRARAAPGSPTAEARAALERAVALDPRQPLYGAQLALLSPTGGGERAATLRLASDGAPGVAALALAAGVAALDAGDAGAAALLHRACAADPLGAPAPFLLAMAAPEAPAAPIYAARALLAAPELGAAVDWEGRRPLLRQALLRVQAWHGVDGGYRRTLALAVTAAPRQGPIRRLLWRFDRQADVAQSLTAFRRRPWPRPPALASVLLRLDAARGLGELPAATALPTSAAAAFPPRCDAMPRR
jgi:hypothetical protein